MALDKQSILAVREGDPLQVELFGGSVYFDIKNKTTHELELKVGQVVIKGGCAPEFWFDAPGTGHS